MIGTIWWQLTLDAVGVVEEQGLAYFDDEESNTFAEVEAMAVDMGFDACGGGEG